MGKSIYDVKVGDQVRFITGGPNMVVSHVSGPNGKKEYIEKETVCECTWYHDGEFRVHRFNIRCIVPLASE